MAERSKTRIANMSIDPNSIKLPDKHKIESSPTTSSNETSSATSSTFETTVERLNKKKVKKPFQFRRSHHRGHGKFSASVCVQRSENGQIKDVIRVSRSEAAQKVATGLWQYCSKTVWRNFLKKSQETVLQENVREAQRASQTSSTKSSKKNKKKSVSKSTSVENT